MAYIELPMAKAEKLRTHYCKQSISTADCQPNTFYGNQSFPKATNGFNFDTMDSAAGLLSEDFIDYQCKDINSHVIGPVNSINSHMNMPSSSGVIENVRLNVDGVNNT
ncbi:unnamed protein product [Heterobilharzia americana]|nr:unnamed protein product [Heterobilharzia americana]